jgi:hypothetical protein
VSLITVLAFHRDSMNFTVNCQLVVYYVESLLHRRYGLFCPNKVKNYFLTLQDITRSVIFFLQIFQRALPVDYVYLKSYIDSAITLL